MKVLYLECKMGAAGDMLIIRRLLSYKSKAGEITYMDHPTEAGGVVLER